jgi:lipopolysaccharide export system permease protein
MLNNFQVEEYQYALPLRRVKIERYRKFTLSIACFIFFFIGAPLGAIIRKGGLGTPVIISMLFFVVYWVVDISGKKLATDGVISPGIGTLISSLILFPIGAYLTWKSTKDSALFNADAYIMFFNKLMARINKYKGEKI